MQTLPILILALLLLAGCQSTPKDTEITISLPEVEYD